MIAHRRCLSDPDPSLIAEPPAEPAAGEAPVAQPGGRRVENTRRWHAAVHELYDKGVGTTRIVKLLGLDHKTVLRYARAATAEELLPPSGNQHGPLYPYQSYLHHRWNQGCTDSSRLFTEIRAMGYQGSDRTVRRWLEPLRSQPGPAPKVSSGPSTRQVTGWLTRHPDALTGEEKLQLKHVLARCPHLATLSIAIRDFALMMTNREGHRLPEWIAATADSDLPPLRGFARSHDHAECWMRPPVRLGRSSLTTRVSTRASWTTCGGTRNRGGGRIPPRWFCLALQKAG
ncbi:hypothetical protein [Acrocarpospora macrocephala]|uniref:hypothetical protein n=1 Tax=Acrocarpospora macrocephala TaxID=150177 RepID=UPI0012D31597|nr:hypothetical protein [Acrocarpospora macrocephala]